MRTLDDLPVVDSTGYPVDIGSEVDGGNGVTGEIVDVAHEPLGQKTTCCVLVRWPDRDLLEPCITQLAFVGGYPVLLCPEITSIDSLELEEAPDGDRIYDCRN